MSVTQQATRPRGFRGLGTWLKGQLLQGRDPRRASHAAATGLAIGVIPMYGMTTIACGLIGVRAGLNHGVVQGFNYLGAPLKVLLLLPFMRLGEWITASPPLGLSLGEITAIFKQGPITAFQSLTGAATNHPIKP